LASAVSPIAPPAATIQRRRCVRANRARHSSVRVAKKTIGPPSRTCRLTITWFHPRDPPERERAGDRSGRSMKAL
jgi:hypothetical protein